MKFCLRKHPQTEENVVRNKLGRIKDCRECVRIRAKKWYKKAPNKSKANEYSRSAYRMNRIKRIQQMRRRVLRVKYGITFDEYQDLFIKTCLKNRKTGVETQCVLEK
jgi:hypothetical protein